VNSVGVAAAKGWASWLDTFKWETYLTLTFKSDTAPEQAGKEYGRYIRFINETIFGKRYRRKGNGISWVSAIEHQRRGVIHFHCLMDGTAKLRYDVLHGLWKKVSDNTGFSWIESYKPGVGATGYLSKYVTKGGELDIYINKGHQDPELFT